jgi:hypothetical protein
MSSTLLISYYLLTDFSLTLAHSFLLQLRLSDEDLQMMMEETLGSNVKGGTVDMKTFLNIMENTSWY